MDLRASGCKNIKLDAVRHTCGNVLDLSGCEDGVLLSSIGCSILLD